jgi:tight adherence protein B
MVMAALTFIFVAAAIVGAYWLFVLRPEEAEKQAFRRRLTGKVDVLPAEQPAARIVAIDDTIQDTPFRPLVRLISESGVEVTVRRVLIWCVCAAILFGGTALVAGRASAAPTAGLIGAMLPIAYLLRKRQVRIQRFDELFPQALETIARALRVGHPLTVGISMAADEVPAPVGPEFRRIYEWQNYGHPIADALKNFAARAPVVDARFFVAAVLMQRETGGNLCDVLDNLVGVIRDRFAVRRQMRVLTAQGRMSGWILASFTPVLALFLMLFHPSHLGSFIHDPVGQHIIGLIVVLEFAGIYSIRRIVRVTY